MVPALQPTRLDEALTAFRDMLCHCWTRVEAAAARSADPYFIDDWMQATWEFYVERAFPAEAGVFLMAYGAGADINGASSRVSLPEARPTHVVTLRALHGDTALNRLSGSLVKLPPTGIPLEEFVAYDGSWYRSAAPFDHVAVTLSERGGVVVLPVDQLRFDLQALARV